MYVLVISTNIFSISYNNIIDKQIGILSLALIWLYRTCSVDILKAAFDIFILKYLNINIKIFPHSSIYE